MHDYLICNKLDNERIKDEVRKLKNNTLIFSKSETSLHSVQFVSSIHNEGVSTISRLFAQVIAEEDEKKILMMDLNFRSYSALPEQEKLTGLSDFLSSDGSSESEIKKTDISNLFILSPGRTQCSPYNLIASKKFDLFFEEIKKLFDLVIIDSPPIQYYPESVLLSSMVDGVILVINAERTKREIVLNAQKKMLASGGNLLGTVLNKQKFYIPEKIYRQL